MAVEEEVEEVVMESTAGTFSAELQDGAIVMRSPNEGFGLQRVVFSDITETSFKWKSEYSMDDGKTWRTVMRLRAHRYDG